MQVKKEEIQKTILDAAQQEFLLHGYEGASMRVIAKKANTTLGNIYHYYKNKEAILETLLEEPVKGLEKLIKIHMEREAAVLTYQEVVDELSDMDRLMGDSEMKYLMDERLVILFDLKTTRFVEKRDEFIQFFKQHIAWHLNMENGCESAYIDILLETFIACIRHALTAHKNQPDVRQEFFHMFKMLCMGLTVNWKGDDRYGNGEAGKIN